MVTPTAKDIFAPGNDIDATIKKQREELARLFRKLAEYDELSHDNLAKIFLLARANGLDVAYWVIQTDSMKTVQTIGDTEYFVQRVTFPTNTTAPVRATKDQAGPLLLAMAAHLEAMHDQFLHNNLKDLRRTFS